MELDGGERREVDDAISFVSSCDLACVYISKICNIVSTTYNYYNGNNGNDNSRGSRCTTFDYYNSYNGNDNNRGSRCICVLSPRYATLFPFLYIQLGLVGRQRRHKRAQMTPNASSGPWVRPFFPVFFYILTNYFCYILVLLIFLKDGVG